MSWPRVRFILHTGRLVSLNGLSLLIIVKYNRLEESN